MKNNFFKYYIIITQVIFSMLVPPLLAWFICKKTNASKIAMILSLIFSTLFGVMMGIIFTYKALKIKTKKEDINFDEKK